MTVCVCVCLKVQLSMSLLAGRRDMRTDCLSAENSNTESRTASRYTVSKEQFDHVHQGLHNCLSLSVYKVVVSGLQQKAAIGD